MIEKESKVVYNVTHLIINSQAIASQAQGVKIDLPNGFLSYNNILVKNKSGSIIPSSLDLNSNKVIINWKQADGQEVLIINSPDSVTPSSQYNPPNILQDPNVYTISSVESYEVLSYQGLIKLTDDINKNYLTKKKIFCIPDSADGNFTLVFPT